MSLMSTVERRGAESGVAHTLQVTPDNFARAESDLQFMSVVKRGGFGRLVHERNVGPPGRHAAPWAEDDVLRSRAVFDLELGPASITLPASDRRFISLEALDEDHYSVGVFHGPGTYTLSFENVSTRYVLIVLRVMVDPADPADLARAHDYQDAVAVARSGGGRFVIPNWDPVSQAKVRVALQLLGNTVSGDERTFGARDEVDPVRHLIGTATRWDGAPPRDIAYMKGIPRLNDGHTQHRLVVGHVPVKDFWSLTVYDGSGHFLTDSHSARTVNSRTAAREADGSVVVNFGAAAAGDGNHLQIAPGWCYLVRLYRPRDEVLGGRWRFPEPQPSFIGAANAGS